MNWFIFDTETTGLIANRLVPLDKQPEIWEIFGLVVNGENGKEMGKFHRIVKPSNKLSQKVKDITGITQEELEQAPPFEIISGGLQGIMKSICQGVIAHNLSYDMGMVNLEFKRLGKTFWWPPRKLCTVEATEHYKGHRLSLTALHEHLFGEGFPEAHRAENDVRALHRVFVELLRRGEI